MKPSCILPLVVCGSLVHALTAAKRDYTRQEHLVLSDCGIETLPNGASKSRQMLYYKGNPWDGKNNWVHPDMVAEVPWDGSYPWRTNGVSSKMPNGDVFTVWIDPAIPDYTAADARLAGHVSHTYDGHELDCYGRHENAANIYTLPNGNKCAPAYICNHLMKDDQPPKPPPPPPPPKSKRSSIISWSEMSISVGETSQGVDNIKIVKPWDAFHNIVNDVHGPQCNKRPYPISGGCTIIFSCSFLDPSDTPAGSSAKLMGDLLTESASRAINASEWVTYSQQWGIPTYHKQYSYPQNGQIAIKTEIEGDPASLAPQSSLSFEIKCSAGKNCDKRLCGALASSSTIAGSVMKNAPGGLFLRVFGSLVAGACPNCS